jgi:LPXTG-motif cell wall-anchored protein
MTMDSAIVVVGVVLLTLVVLMGLLLRKWKREDDARKPRR